MSPTASRTAMLVVEPRPQLAAVAATTAPTSDNAAPATPGNDGKQPSGAANQEPSATTAAANFAAKAGGAAVTADTTTGAAAAPIATPVKAPAALGSTAHVGAPVSPPKSPADAGSIGGAVFALVLVIGLILVLAWLAKRMPGIGAAGNTSALRVVGSLALGPRERVVVVAVGQTQLLLGVGAGGTRTLHTLAEPLPVAPAKTAPAFAQLLAQHFGNKA